MAILDSIAIIPARGGSKRIPQKNIQDFFGKPLIAHSIITALESKLFSRVIVSTDSLEIASIAKKYGAEIPFIRHLSLSDDFTPTLEVVADAIHQSKILDSTLVCCIYPTAPLLQVRHLIQAHQIFKTHHPSYVFLATSFSFTPFRGFSYKNQKLEMLFAEHQNSRSQDLDPIYHDAGQFYLGLAQTFRKKMPIFSSSSIPLIVEAIEVQDIDTPQDLALAKLKYKLLNDKD